MIFLKKNQQIYRKTPEHKKINLFIKKYLLTINITICQLFCSVGKSRMIEGRFSEKILNDTLFSF